jgi:hypothetical protein
VIDRCPTGRRQHSGSAIKGAILSEMTAYPGNVERERY